jgi:hypothetical protein
MQTPDFSSFWRITQNVSYVGEVKGVAIQLL